MFQKTSQGEFLKEFKEDFFFIYYQDFQTGANSKKLFQKSIWVIMIGVIMGTTRVKESLEDIFKECLKYFPNASKVDFWKKKLWTNDSERIKESMNLYKVSKEIL